MSKLTEWGRRYIPPTFLSVILSLALGLTLQAIFHNPLVTALGGTWGDNIGFYGLIFYKDIKARRKIDKKLTLIGILKVIRNAVAEFGVGECLDSFLIRPFLMLLFPRLVGNYAVGI